jgi:hypothetical protein
MPILPPAGADGLSASIERPTSNDVVAGTVNISGSSSGAQGVQVSIDAGAWWNATGVPGWRYLWNCSGAPNGVHSVQARAYSGPEYAGSAAVQFTVNNTPPSSLELTIDISPQQVYSGEDFTASGSARYDTGVRVTGSAVQIGAANVTTNATTDSRGFYSAQMVAPNAPGRTVVRSSLTASGLSGTASGSIDVVLRSPPDLSVSAGNISFDPPQPSGGEEFTIGAIISNQGGSNASARVSFTTQGHDQEDVLLNVTAGGSWPSSVKWKLPSGNHTLEVRLLDIKPYDANSSNDNASREVHVLAAPDLALAAIVFSNSRPTEGMAVTVQARIFNSGEKNATGTVTIYDGNATSGTALGSQRVAVPANSTRMVLVNWNTTRGSHNITAVVKDVLLEDSDPSNDNLARQIIVAKKSSPPPGTAPGFEAATALAVALVICVLGARKRAGHERCRKKS